MEDALLNAIEKRNEEVINRDFEEFMKTGKVIGNNWDFYNGDFQFFMVNNR